MEANNILPTFILTVRIISNLPDAKLLVVTQKKERGRSMRLVGFYTKYVATHWLFFI